MYPLGSVIGMSSEADTPQLPGGESLHSRDDARLRVISAAYSSRAEEYAELLGSMDAVADADRRLVEVWAQSTEGPLADVGCGPAHWTAHLADRGHDILGIEPVPEFVAYAHRTSSHIRVEQGSFATLPTAAFEGILSWYSLIHTPPEDMHALLSNAHRALRPDGSLLLGFFAGERVEPFAHDVAPAWYWPVSELELLLTTAGFTVINRGTRQDPGVRRHGWIEALRTH